MRTPLVNKLMCHTKSLVILAVLVVQSFVVLPARSQAYRCWNTGFSVVFFNGVWNSYAEAKYSKDYIKTLIGSIHGTRREITTYILAYNVTAGKYSARDLEETFEQRANEVDPSGALAKRTEFLWDIVQGGTLLDQTLSASGLAVGALDNLKSSLSAITTDAASMALSGDATAQDYASHNAALETLILAQKKVLLIGHSQGNLFLNHAYEYISHKYGTQGMAVEHIANAATTTHGPYFISTKDLIIRPLLIGSSYTANVPMPLYNDDFFGHGFVKTYMNPSKEAEKNIEKALNVAFQVLEQNNENTCTA